MRFEGRLKSWNTERGFGFIEPVDGGQDTFLHVSAVPTSLRPPKVGQQFTFEVTLSRDGKKRAANVGVAVAPRSRHAPRVATPAKWSPASALAIPLFLAIYVAVAATRGVSIWFAIAYVGFSVVAVSAIFMCARVDLMTISEANSIPVVRRSIRRNASAENPLSPQ